MIDSYRKKITDKQLEKAPGTRPLFPEFLEEIHLRENKLYKPFSPFLTKQLKECREVRNSTITDHNYYIHGFYLDRFCFYD